MKRFIGYVISLGVGACIFWVWFPNQPWQMLFGAAIGGVIYWSIDEIL